MKHAPVIIIGMHRSGTTLLAKLLKQAGLWIGNDLIDTWESRFFLNRNEKILNAGGGSWASPECAEAILGHSSLRRALTLELKQDASSAFCAGYLGLKRYIKHRSLFNLQEPWGWKEPRTMLLLPLYLDIFPGAKVIHIVRNGVDVAASLARREQVRLEQTILKKSASEKLGALSREYNKEPSFFSLLHNYAISARLRYHPVEKYRKYGLLPIASTGKGL
ncbi:MAG: sulfotransferase [candidate division KSB1 bacterium]|nr:sulfotransferase [candidate division KSB1 bacterium]